MKTSPFVTSVRRYFIDNFFFAHVNQIRGRVLDIGGKKINKRGLFDISKFNAEVKYVDIDSSVEPDILADASAIPVEDASFETVIMGELLEHVIDPTAVLREAWRILVKGGKIIATIPFMVGIHSDPSDFGRYTEHFWKEKAKKLGFEIIFIERQGTIFAVVALMLQHLFMAKKISWRPIQFPLIQFLMCLGRKTTAPLLIAWTTGYGLILKKQ